MAKLELPEETRARVEAAGEADLLIAIPAAVRPEQVRAEAERALAHLATTGDYARLRTVVSYPGEAGAANGNEAVPEAESAAGPRFLPYAPPAAQLSAISSISWLAPAATYRFLFNLAAELKVKAMAVAAPDLALLQTNSLGSLVAPTLDGGWDLAMPVYPAGKLEGLLNSSILSPLPRALYGRRVRFPLAQDFAVSARMVSASAQPRSLPSPEAHSLFWPATEAVLRGCKICQVPIGVHRVNAAEGIDLSTVLGLTVGPLFGEMETHAALWQRIRGSEPVGGAGSPAPAPEDGAAADPRSMLETFQLGFRNLQEIWSMVLPPATLLELKRLSRLSAEQFRMPDDLWVRIIYDFALAHRLRTISRGHLLGALTPLYLGWVAAHVLEIGSAYPAEAAQRVERLARAYEDGKPYLLSRWRWPDRFNP